MSHLFFSYWVVLFNVENHPNQRRWIHYITICFSLTKEGASIPPPEGDNAISIRTILKHRRIAKLGRGVTPNVEAWMLLISTEK